MPLQLKAEALPLLSPTPTIDDVGSDTHRLKGSHNDESKTASHKCYGYLRSYSFDETLNTLYFPAKTFPKITPARKKATAYKQIFRFVFVYEILLPSHVIGRETVRGAATIVHHLRLIFPSLYRAQSKKWVSGKRENRSFLSFPFH